MGRYLGPSCRLCRREGMKLFLKGVNVRLQSVRSEKRQRNLAPGMHGWRSVRVVAITVCVCVKSKRSNAITAFMEKAFMKCFREAERMKGNTGVALLQLLEQRLDNVVYKLNWAPSRKSSRQLISHGHVYVNGRKVNISSFSVRVVDKLTIKNADKSVKMVKEQLDSSPNFTTQAWLQLDRGKPEATVVALPTREDIQIPVEEQLVCGNLFQITINV